MPILEFMGLDWFGWFLIGIGLVNLVWMSWRPLKSWIRKSDSRSDSK